MQIIPVIDLLNGVVVRGIAGRREEYRPIQSQLAVGSEPTAIARALAQDFGFDTAYVADLDAIQHGRPSIGAWHEIAGAGLRLWLDAGIGNLATAQRIAGLLDQAKMDARLVVGLESLESAEALTAIGLACSSRSPIFSLDLQAGQPLTRVSLWRHLGPLQIAQIAIGAGYRDMIVLDLADVGTNAGTRTLELCRRLRALGISDLQLVAGGGVRSVADLRILQSAGCAAALVASALHDKRLTPDDVREFTN